MKKNLIVIAGPTASGKSALSIEVAKALKGQIISGDSIQVYKKLDIGSAKITQEEMEGIKHYCIDELEPEVIYDVTKFQSMAKEAMEEIYKSGHTPILCGGTGFYIQALVNDIDFEDTEADNEYRKELEAIAEKDGGEDILYNMLSEVDPESTLSIHKNNVKRVIRALEYYKLTGLKISDHNKVQKEKTSPYNTVFIVLTDDRETLYNRIDKRVDKMVEDGLAKEVKELKDMGLTLENTSMQGIGYKEIYNHLCGEYSLEEAVELIKKDTRHFAKRQITWFKREKDAIWVDRSQFKDSKELTDYVINIIKKELEKNGSES